MAIKYPNKPKTLRPLLAQWQSTKYTHHPNIFRYAQYMGNHMKNIFWPLTHQVPNCTLCHRKRTWHMAPLIIYMWAPISRGLKIARHNKSVHLITQTLQADKNTRFLTLTNASYINNQPQEQTIPEWLLQCTCHQKPCQCQAKLKPDILCMIGAPNQTSLPISPSSNHIVQFIEFTYCHDRFPEQAITQKHAKYDPLNSTIQNNGWTTNPLITITAGVRGSIHEHSIDKLKKLNIPKSGIKNTMKDIHQNAIKYLTYLVLNKKTRQQANTCPPPPTFKLTTIAPP